MTAASHHFISYDNSGPVLYSNTLKRIQTPALPPTSGLAQWPETFRKFVHSLWPLRQAADRCMPYYSDPKMKWNIFIFIFLLTDFFTSCQTATDKTLEKFKKVDSSLQKSNSIINDNAYSILYRQIQAKRDNNLKLALQADTLFQTTQDANRFIDDLIQKLNELDSSGIQLDIGTNLITNTNNSEKLTQKLNSVYTSALSVLTYKQQIAQAENIFKVEQEIKANKNWSRKYFDRTPTIAAVTILRKFKNDCVNLATLSLKEIKTDLVE